MRAKAATILVGAGIILSASCWVRNPDTCGPGYPDCVSSALPYCDMVAKKCVAVPPGDMGLDGGRDGGDMGPSCTSSATCSAASPICSSLGTCGQCLASDDGAGCTAHSAATPRCKTGTGACVACLPGSTAPQSTDCGATTPICDGATNTCRACTAHSDCASLVCNLDGTCAAEATIAYVDNAGATCSGAHAGTKADPYCQIQSAVDAASPKATIRVLGSSAVYDKVNISSGNFTIVGPGQKGTTPAAIVSYTTGSAFNVSGMSTVVTIDGFEVTGGTANQDAISCSNNPIGPTLTVRRSYIHDVGGAGINVSKCKVTLDRNHIGPGCIGGGIALSGAQYSVTNNFIVGNVSATSAAVSFNSGSTEIAAGPGFRANTVAKNTNAGGLGGIACNSGTTEIRDSIVWSNTTGNTGGVGTCNLTNVVTAPAMDPDFVNITLISPDFHLSGKTTNNNACCIDKVTSTPVLVDYDGRSRPQPAGGMSDIGAHEVP